MSSTDLLTATVVICAFTEKRWELLQRSIVSVGHQTVSPVEVIVCIDHNHELYLRLKEWIQGQQDSLPFEVDVIENELAGRLGSARNSAVKRAKGDIVAFIDDDARAEPNWLELTLNVFRDEEVYVVGGRPLPEYGGERPRWLPSEFNWIFGCHYEGLPSRRGPVDHLIGASMAARTSLLREIGGFHSDNHDDMDLSHRSRQARPGSSVIYEPMAIVHHYVGPERLTWGYFWRRCFFVNRGKVRAFHDMGEAGNLSAELRFLSFVIRSCVPRYLRSGLGGDMWGPVQALVIIMGLALGGMGNVLGKMELLLRPNQQVLTQGLDAL